MASKEKVEKKVPAWKKAAAIGLAGAALTSVAGYNNLFEEKTCDSVSPKADTDFTCTGSIQVGDKIPLDTKDDPLQESSDQGTILVTRSDETVAKVLFPHRDSSTGELLSQYAKVVEVGSPEFVDIIMGLPNKSFKELNDETRAAATMGYLDDVIEGDTSVSNDINSSYDTVREALESYYDLSAYKRVRDDFKNATPEDIVEVYRIYNTSLALVGPSRQRTNALSVVGNLMDADSDARVYFMPKPTAIEVLSEDKDSNITGFRSDTRYLEMALRDGKTSDIVSVYGGVAYDGSAKSSPYSSKAGRDAQNREGSLKSICAFTWQKTLDENGNVIRDA